MEIAMPKILETDASKHVCPYNAFEPCFGADCMAWQWVGPDCERIETDNLHDTHDGPRPSGAVPAPDGAGWEADGAEYDKGYHQSQKLNLPKARAQRWTRTLPRAEGQCGRTGADNCYPF